MKSLLICTSVAAFLLALPASAQTISGKYIVTITKFCQMVDTYHFSPEPGGGNYLDGINTDGSNFKQSMYAATFSPAKSSVTINGFDNGGDVEIFQFTGSINGTEGSLLAQVANSNKTSYSNNATTITISGQSYNALYGQVNKKSGIVGYIAFQAVFANDQGTMCTEQGVAQAQ